MLSDLLYRLRALFRHKSMEAELDEELRAHFERQVEKCIQSGLTRDEAKRQTRLEFGGLDQVKEECRDARGVRFLETLIQDIRFGLRMLLKNRGFTAVAVLTFALGIGATTAMFSVIEGAILDPFPYANTRSPGGGGRLTIRLMVRTTAGDGSRCRNFSTTASRTTYLTR